jgi:hypothetical protein
MIAVGVFLPLVAGWLFAGRLLPGQGRLVRAATAFGLAVGATSVEYFLTLLILGRPSRTASGLFAGAWLVVACACQVERPATPAAGPRRTRWIWPAALFVGWMSLQAGAEVVGWLAASPHGQWDGYAIWNVRARGLYRGGPDWRDAFDASRPHGDYPLLVPATVARLWTWNDDEFPLAGGPLGVACLVGIATLVGAGVGRLRGPELGCLAVGFLLANPWFVGHAGWQYADAPLSFFLTGAVVVWVLGRNGPGGLGPVAVVGLFLGFAAWTKNEGLAFAAVFLTAAAVEAAWAWRSLKRDARGTPAESSTGPTRSLRHLASLGGGFVIAGATLLVFKVTVAAENDLVEGQNRDTVAKLTDPSRYRAVLSFAWDYFTGQKWFHLLMLPAAVVALGFGPRPRGVVVPTAALVGTAAVYFLVYITTPRDLDWHLGTSFDRLVTHLLPAAYFLLFAVLRPVNRQSSSVRPASGGGAGAG